MSVYKYPLQGLQNVGKPFQGVANQFLVALHFVPLFADGDDVCDVGLMQSEFLGCQHSFVLVEMILLSVLLAAFFQVGKAVCAHVCCHVGGLFLLLRWAWTVHRYVTCIQRHNFKSKSGKYVVKKFKYYFFFFFQILFQKSE